MVRIQTKMKYIFYDLWAHPILPGLPRLLLSSCTRLGTRKSEQQVTSRPAITVLFFTLLLPSFSSWTEQWTFTVGQDESQLEILIWLYSIQENAGVLDGNLMFHPTTTLREFKDRNTSSDLAGQAILAGTLVSEDGSLKWNRMVDEVKKNKH